MRPGSWAAAVLQGGRGYSVVLGEGRQHLGGANVVVHDYYSSVQVRMVAICLDARKSRSPIPWCTSTAAACRSVAAMPVTLYRCFHRACPDLKRFSGGGAVWSVSVLL